MQKCGIGKVNAALGAQRMINEFHPDIIISSGCAGGNGDDVNVQDVAVSSELKSDDERLKGLYPVTFFKSGNMFKGLYGGTTDYNQARKTLAAIREKFPDAFIVAYLGEEPISTARALELTR